MQYHSTLKLPFDDEGVRERPFASGFLDSKCLLQSLLHNEHKKEGQSERLDVDDRLWEEYAVRRQEDQSGVEKWIDGEVSGLLDRGNKHLAKLDNGGFEVVMVGHVTKMSKSDVSLGDTYTDRGDGNKIKEFSPENVWAQTFAFQEAVFNLPPALKKEVNLRILFTKGDKGKSEGKSEEHCICDQHPTFQYGCIAVFFIDSLDKFPASTLFAHELGHTLGYGEHDDNYYKDNSTLKGQLYMWSMVGFG